MITDQFTGVVLTGKLEFQTECKSSFARVTGNVNLENKSGFTRFRHPINKKFDNKFLGLKLSVTGNN